MKRVINKKYQAYKEREDMVRRYEKEPGHNAKVAKFICQGRGWRCLILR